MTMGLFVPLDALLTAPLFAWQLRRLLGETDLRYDEPSAGAAVPV